MKTMKQSWEEFKRGLADSRLNEARKLDAKAVKRALKANPEAKWVYATCRSKRDATSLLMMDWEIVDRIDRQLLGTTYGSQEILLRKPNPHLAAKP